MYSPIQPDDTIRTVCWSECAGLEAAGTMTANANSASQRPPHLQPALVDLYTAVPVHRHQLHRPPDAIGARALSQAGLRLEQYRLRQDRDRLPSGVRHRAERVRPADGPLGHAARPHLLRALVFRGGDVELP